MKIRKVGLIGALLFATTSAQAAFITVDEAGLDAVYAQSSFLTNGNGQIIDIRIGAATELVLPTLLDITTNAEVTALFAQHIGSANVVNFYFIDTISACGATISASIVGCGEFPGNDFVVESNFADSANNAELLGHELGHNLGLAHRTSATALMNPSINGGIDLINSEVTTVRGSVLIQGDDINGFFIDINPVLIVAQATIVVSAPGSLYLMMWGLAYLGTRRRRNIKN
jgi:hypothetical protein